MLISSAEKDEHICRLVSALKECSNSKNLQSGKRIHADCIENGNDSNIYVANTLVDMYSKCGSLVNARQVFDQMQHHSVVSWSALMMGYARKGEGEITLHLFGRMRRKGCAPNPITFVAALKACTNLAIQETGKSISGKVVKKTSLMKGIVMHSEAEKYGFETNISVANSLIDMYAKCGSMGHARRVYEHMQRRDVISWTALLLGYADNGEGVLALEYFLRKRPTNCAPDALTFVAALKACSSIAEASNEASVKRRCLQSGIAIHSEAAERACDSHIYVANTLIDMYAKCGSMVQARSVFEKIARRSVVSWTALLMGYAENGDGELALQLFPQMQSDGCTSDARTFVAVVKACSELAEKEEAKIYDGKFVKVRCLEKGIELHLQAQKNGCELDISVANSLVQMYAKCGCMVRARAIYDKVLYPDVVLWTALMLGYADNGEGNFALYLFLQLRPEKCAPDAQAFVAALKACGSLGDLENGRRIHEEVRRCELESNAIIANCLMDFYGKCGSMIEAREVFDNIARKDGVHWSALLAGYGRQGDTKQVFDLLERMKKERLEVDGVSFLSILAACSHAGLVDEGKKYFAVMQSEYGIAPNAEHYHCMIDILGRSNQLDDAVAMLKSMPFPANTVTWTTILSACRKWTNVQVGRLAFESLIRLDANNSSAYVSMANIYESAGMWEEKLCLQEMLEEKESQP